MKHLKRIFENTTDKLYLIEEDHLDSLGAVGIYNNIESFIKDMESHLLKDEGKSGLSYEITKVDGRDAVKFTWGYSYNIYYFSEIVLNTLFDVN